MFTRRPTATRSRHASRGLRFASILALTSTALPTLSAAQPSHSEIDTITTGSIPSQAMLWTVDPSVILLTLLAAFVALSVAGFALTRRSFKDAAIKQQRQANRSFE